MKKKVLLAAGWVALVVLCSSGRAVAGESMTPAMAEDIRTNGIAVFLEHARERKWTAPKIVSKWYIEHRAKPEEKGAFEQARTQGRVILDTLDATAKQPLPEKNEEVATLIQRLVELGWWLRRTEGYGNLLLVQRAADLAPRGLGRLIADLQFDMGEASNLLASVQGVVSDQAILIARILNDEAGEKLFDPNTREMKELHQVWREYAGAWTYHKAMVELEKDKNMPARVKEKWKTWYRTTGEAMGWTASVLTKHGKPRPFFDENGDSWPRPCTTRSCWDIKAHERLLIRYQPRHLRSLADLLKFRAKVGSFPEHVKDPTRVLNHLSDAKNAFREAWRPYRSSDGVTVYSSAYHAYEKVKEGSLRDHDAEAEWFEKLRELPRPNPPGSDGHRKTASNGTSGE